MESHLPVDLLHWSLAIFPMILLLLMLVVFRWSGGTSGWVAMGVATLFSFFIFRASFENVAVGFGKGLWEAFYILLVIWTALLLYHTTEQSGSFKVIRHEIQRYSENYLFLVLGFGWVFASFLQGVAGFGVPVAVVAPLLIGIGVKPIPAIVIPLIGHAWANTFGTLGVAWIATTNVVHIEHQALTLLYTGILLWIPNIIAGFAICWIFAKWKGVKEGWVAVVVISLIHGGGQLAIVTFNPELSAFIPATLAVGALFLLEKRTKRYSEKTGLEKETTILKEMDSDEKDRPEISLHQAFMPYYVLSVTTVIMMGITPAQDFLNQFSFGFSFPAVETGYGFQMDAEEVYNPMAPLTHPAFFLLLSSVFAYIWYKYLGLMEKGMKKNIVTGAKDNAVGATFAITGFMTMAMIMENSGQTNVIAFGIAEVSSPAVYTAIASVIGIVGSFMTSSNTSSNVLFAPLHGAVGDSMERLSMSLVIATQSAGGAIGNVIAPANVILGTSTAGAHGREAEVYKITIVFAFVVGIIVSMAAVLFHFIFV
ncbi:L-lactate permease [Salicibibacter cibarius]|uniref:L-lactate permease n=1 Tax=Salicibibacter cibarius TaxID=2743000 RepID=A0A7T7CAA4_9BACI|nr:L-lactate permease [Salicibibacter cibarius]QQK74684.1 L-lactate permease [Salicibibacter cibarius]